MAGLPSPATLILHRAGLTVTEIAEHAGVAQPSVSAQLAGRRFLQENVLDTIRRCGGNDVAEEVQAAAALARSEYLLEVQAGRM